MTTSESIHTCEGVATLRRSARKTWAISVHPDGSLELIAPMESAVSDILAKVLKRRRWIRKQRKHFAEMNAQRNDLRYVNGATHRYLGRQYRIKVILGESKHVALKGGYFHVTISHSDEQQIEQALQSWYQQKAKEQFTQRLEPWLRWCQKHRLPQPVLQLRKMPKRWGSASASGVIRLHPRLIRMPSVCIDYVITHELCHLKHPDHSTKFYRLLTSLMPHWKEVKQRLERAEEV
jgi:predicted metal-dependent hydrolase